MQRKAGLRFLTTSNLKYFIDDILPPMFETMALRLDAAADAGTIIDLQQELLDLTTRFFGKVAYDVRRLLTLLPLLPLLPHYL